MTDYAALVAEARKIAEEATDAPWFSDGVRVILDDRNGMVDLRLVAIAQSESPRMTSGHEADAAFIARARTLVPELCDAVKEQAATIRLLRGGDRDHKDCGEGCADPAVHYKHLWAAAEAENTVLRAQIAAVEAAADVQLPQSAKDAPWTEGSIFERGLVRMAERVRAALSKPEPEERVCPECGAGRKDAPEHWGFCTAGKGRVSQP